MGTAGTSKGRRERRDTGQREQGGHASELLFDYVDKRKLQDHLVASLRMKPQPKSGWSIGDGLSCGAGGEQRGGGEAVDGAGHAAGAGVDDADGVVGEQSVAAAG